MHTICSNRSLHGSPLAEAVVLLVVHGTESNHFHYGTRQHAAKQMTLQVHILLAVGSWTP